MDLDYFELFTKVVCNRNLTSIEAVYIGTWKEGVITIMPSRFRKDYQTDRMIVFQYFESFFFFFGCTILSFSCYLLLKFHSFAICSIIGMSSILVSEYFFQPFISFSSLLSSLWLSYCSSHDYFRFRV